MRKVHTAALTVATLVVAGAYYGLADSLDIVPGPLTAASQSYETQPYPTPSIPPDGQDAPSGLDPDAPAPTATSLSSLANALASDSQVGGATTAVTVIDVATGETLLDTSSTPLTPASSNKILTASAALSLLGPEHALTTKAVVSGGTVTLVGGGDVLLAADAGDPDATVGHAGLGDLARSTAQALQARGVTSVNVALDDTLFTGPSWNSSWEGGNEAWVAQIQPIMLDVTAHSHTGGYPADPAMEAAQTFSDQLASAGVTVSGDVSRSAAPSDATELASVASAPLADVLSVSLKASDNTMTEVEGLRRGDQGRPGPVDGGRLPDRRRHHGRLIRAGDGGQGSQQPARSDHRPLRGIRRRLRRQDAAGRPARRRPGRDPGRAVRRRRGSGHRAR